MHLLLLAKQHRSVRGCAKICAAVHMQFTWRSCTNEISLSTVGAYVVESWPKRRVELCLNKFIKVLSFHYIATSKLDIIR